jgi:hypothetical protein
MVLRLSRLLKVRVMMRTLSLARFTLPILLLATAILIGGAPPPAASATFTPIFQFTEPGILPQGVRLNPGLPTSIAPTGTLFGTTRYGGDSACDGGCGTVFMLMPPATPGAQWQLVTLHRFNGKNFPGSLDGVFPNADLSAGPRGDLFGTTLFGGGQTAPGTIFELSPPKVPGGNWIYKIIHSFSYSYAGFPKAGLTLDRDGVLYGTTSAGKASPTSVGSGGTVFALTPPHFRGTPSLPPNPGLHWQVRYLVNLADGIGLDGTGHDPEGKLVLDNFGNIFGTARGRGGRDCGNVFEVIPPANTGRSQWIGKAIYIFPIPTRYPPFGYACRPVGRLVRSDRGALFGMTEFGGIFEVLSGSGSTIGAAATGPGTGPNPGLLLNATTGILYGGWAGLFALVPTADPTVWTQTTLWTFQEQTNPGFLTGTLIFDLSGNLVGTLADGTVFEFSFP